MVRAFIKTLPYHLLPTGESFNEKRSFLSGHVDFQCFVIYGNVPALTAGHPAVSAQALEFIVKRDHFLLHAIYLIRKKSYVNANKTSDFFVDSC